MDKLTDLIRKIHQRPYLYLSKKRFDLLDSLLWGFEFGRGVKPMSIFDNWLTKVKKAPSDFAMNGKINYLYCNGKLNFEKIENEQENIFNFFFDLYEEFLHSNSVISILKN